MSFPTTPLDLRAELYVGGAWTDMSSTGNKVYQRDGTSPPVVITRGRPDEASSVNPASCTFQANNRNGNLSPDNPLGAWYGSLGRNTPLRLSVPVQVNYMRLESDSASNASAPDSAGLSITGDTEIQLDMWLSGWSACVLAAKWNGGLDDTWALLLNADGTLRLSYYDGSNIYASASTVPLPVQHRIAVKATLKLNDGSGNHVVTFYTASSIAGSWAQLGASVTVAGTISALHDSAAPVEVGFSSGWVVTDGNSYTGMNGRVYEFKLLSGIGGTTKADPVFSARSAGDTSWNDAQSNTWSLNGTAEISDRDYRFHGELSSLPPRWDVTAADIYVPVQAGGLLRRLGQGSAPSVPAMSRYYGTFEASALAAWWPMEDGSGSTQLASGNGGWPMYFSGSPQLASSTAFPGAQALPVSNKAVFTGRLDWGSISWTDNDVRFLVEIPSGGEAAGGGAGTTVAWITTTGTVATVQVLYTTASGGTLFLNGWNAAGTSLFAGAAISGVNGERLALQVAIQPVLGNVDVSLQAVTPGGTSVITTGTFYSGAGSVGAVTGIQLNADGGLASTVFGHAAILPAFADIGALNGYSCPDGSVTGPLNAWAGEPAGIRFGRLCGEASLQFRGIGWLYSSAPMGAQTAQPLTGLLQECEDADRGQIVEPRTCLGLGYRVLSSMYSQSPAVTLDYSLAELGGTSGGTALEPVYDDQYLRNDWTVTRSASAAGTSYRSQLNDGSALAVGIIGDYGDSKSINVQLDTQVPDVASWLVHLGTTTGARWPVIPVNLARSAVSSLYYPLLALDIGDYAEITNPLNKVTYDPVKQLAWAVKESLGGFFHELELSCVPELPYEVAVAGSAHADTDGTTLHAGVSAGATSMGFETGGGALWSTSGGDYPLNVMIAGELVTVTAVSGGSSPQTATVTRAVNGVSKAQAINASVDVYPPPVAAL